MKTFNIAILSISIISMVVSEHGETYLDNDENIINKRLEWIKDTTIEDNPYQVTVQRGEKRFSGFIISPTWVMTAAHIFFGLSVSPTTIRAGSDFQNSGGITFTVLNEKTHDDYNTSTVDYDFALLKINGTFTYSMKIQPAVLPKADENVPIFGLMQISGWGLQLPGVSTHATLKYFHINYIPYVYCNAAYHKSITDRMFCGGNWFLGGIGACHGGSGAPVKYKGVVIGLVSFVSGYCTSTLKPDVYAKISSVIPWIKTVTGIP